MSAGIEMACDVKLDNQVLSRRRTLQRERCHRSVLGGIDEQHALLVADQVGVLEQKLITLLYLRVRAAAFRLKPIDEGPAQTVVLATDVADPIYQAGVIVELVECHERTRSLITFPAGS